MHFPEISKHFRIFQPNPLASLAVDYFDITVDNYVYFGYSPVTLKQDGSLACPKVKVADCLMSL